MPSFTLLLQDLPVSAAQWKQQALAWAQAENEVVAYYDPNNIPYLHGGFQNLLGLRKHLPIKDSPVTASDWNGINPLLKHNSAAPLLGFLTYDLKNGLENLSSAHPDNVGFPEMYFFVPEVWLQWTQDAVTINSTTLAPKAVAQAIDQTPFLPVFPKNTPKIKARFSKENYLAAVHHLRTHILEGDVYEVNLCMEFYAEDFAVDPLATYLQLNQASPTPFSGFLKLRDRYLMCASPERFLKKEGNLLISQPIKGTVRRGKNEAEDVALRNALKNSEKERAENMMIVDLVRNDLNRVAQTGTVQVEEMFGLYPFQYVWQMISTVTATLPPGRTPVEALQAAFPMGSMTGAPKIRAMELIEHYEKTKRGLYSGSLGYFLPNGDFDFNVVIRSLQYNAQTQYLSYQVGSAITFDSDPEKEFEECLLKAEAIVHILQK